MSNLSSVFDVIGGLEPHDKSALELSLKQKAAESPVLTEGMIAAITNEVIDTVNTPVFTKLTSANNGGHVLPDYPFLIQQGADQSDAQVADKISGLLLRSGVIFRVATAGSFSIGDLVYANAGVITKVDVDQQAFGQVIDVNTAAGWIVIST